MGGSSGSREPSPSVSAAGGFDPGRIEIGLPWPWHFRKIAIRGDTCFFWGYSPRTLAVGAEHLQDGFIVFLGMFVAGWASISAAMERGEAGEQ
jgi:hypothetical protein